MAVRAAWDEVRYTVAGPVTCQVTPDWVVRAHPRTAITFRTHNVDPEFKDELFGFLSRCRPGMILLDIGAHYGIFTLAALHAGGPTARVWAVEPSMVCRRLLGVNARSNGVADRVTIVPEAIGAVDGELPMLTTGAGGHDFLVAPDDARPDSSRVVMTTLSTLAAKIPVPVTHLKRDIEGFESEALAGGREYLREHRPVLFLELHGDILRSRGKNPAALLTDLADCRYTRIEHRGHEITIVVAARMPLARLVCIPFGWETPNSLGGNP